MKTFTLANVSKRSASEQTNIQAAIAPSIEALHDMTCIRGWAESDELPDNCQKLWRQGEVQFFGQL